MQRRHPGGCLRCVLSGRRLFAAKREDLYHEEGDRYAEHRGNEIAHDGRESQQVVKDDDDDILDDVVRQVGYEKSYIPGQREVFLENDTAVHPVGDDVADDVADIEVQVIVRADKGAEPGQKYAVEGIDTTDHEKKEKFPGQEMVADLFFDLQAQGPFRSSGGIIPAFRQFVNFFRLDEKLGIVHFRWGYYN